MADYISIGQIWGNLIENAIMFLDPGRPGRIEIGGEKKDTETTFYIKDNGRGIEDKDLDRIFQIFQRAGKEDKPGEGMGLAYVKTLVSRHDGTIQCESIPGEGSTFTFTISHNLK